eukprot:jgi/Undpi1/274/HiC_scaffold_1.g00270.m1
MTVLHSKSPEVATLAPAGEASEVVVGQNATGNESNLRAPTSKPKAQALAEYGLTALFFIVFCGPAFLEVISQYWSPSPPPCPLPPIIASRPTPEIESEESVPSTWARWAKEFEELVDGPWV